jgi:hypothetical protein
VLLIARPAPTAAAITMTAGFELSPTYRTNCWQPIRLELRNDGPTAIEGSAVVPLADPQAPASMTLPLTLPPGALVRATIWAYFPPPTLTPQQARKGEIPPLAMTEFRDRGGALLARAELVGLPLSRSSAKDASDRDERSEVILVVGQREDQNDQLYEPASLIGQLSEDTGVALGVANVELDRLPRQAAGLRAIKAVVLEAMDPDSLDQAQREALLQYVRGGGVIVLAAPNDSLAKAGTWLEPLLPARLVGTRQASQIDISPGAALKLRQPVELVEAVEGADGAGSVLLRDACYVHVVEKACGLGKVVFTSFPINALAESQSQAVTLWKRLLSLEQPQWDWRQTRLGQDRYAILGSMIGRKVAAWAVAAAVAGGYLLVLLLAQGFFTGASRPKAFVVSLAVALTLSIVLVAMGMARRGEQSLQSARLGVIDVTREGGGWQQESIAFVGADDPKMDLKAADERTLVRPARADQGNRPSLRQQPFAVEHADVYAERIERVWESSGPANRDWRIDAKARFGPNGLTLAVDNAIGQSLVAPLVVWNHRALSLADLPAGQSSVGVLHLNERDDFTNASVLASEQSKRRAQLIKASLSPPADAGSAANPPDTGPMLVGWLGDASGSELATPSQAGAIDRKAMVMVRAPISIEVSPPGSKIAVPAALVGIEMGRLPYDPLAGESPASQQPGEWLVGFAVPREIGQVRPTHVTLEARVTLPGHTLSIRRGQCVGGTPKTNANGPLVVEWGREVGNKQVDIDSSAGDYDSDGRVWLRLEIRPVSATTGGTGGSPVSWQIKDLGMNVEAEAVAPPRPRMLEERR